MSDQIEKGLTPTVRWLDKLVDDGRLDRALPRHGALRVLDRDCVQLLPLIHAAGRIRRHYFGNRVLLHRLNNVQNGACPEDCGYCGQSKVSDAPIQPYRLKPIDEIVEEAAQAKAAGAFRYCMVLSGRGPSDDEIAHMADCIGAVKRRFGLETCLSVGLLRQDQSQRLADAGLDRLNHNLNTSAAHYPQICSTHTYQDRIDSLTGARAAGLSLCSGLIVGMGESLEDVIDVAYALREMRIESVPVNFLVPIEGNAVTDAVCNGQRLTPQMCLRVLCLFRFVNPSAEIRIGAGREGHLRSMQTLALHPANSLFVDDYLLTRGSSAAKTVRMIVDAGFEIELPASSNDDQGATPSLPDELRELVESVRSGAVGGGAFTIDDDDEADRNRNHDHDHETEAGGGHGGRSRITSILLPDKIRPRHSEVSIEGAPISGT